MAKTTDGGFAFARPSSPGDGSYSAKSQQGMTLRDYFAAQVLSGIAKEPGEGCTGYITQRVRVAYQIADAMLAERAK